MKKQRPKLIALLLSAVLILTPMFTSISAFGATQYVDTSEYESLAEIYSDYFKVGAACEAISHWNQSVKEIGNPNKEAVIARLFNSITCGNELKPAYNFNFASETLFKVDHSGEEMLQWAKNNGTNMRFHVLVWHAQVDPSFFAKDFKATSNGMITKSDTAELDEDCLVDRDTLIERLRTYIYGALEYVYSNGFAETVYAIDVVNEAVDESKDDGLRRSYWYKIIGPEFLYYAFLFAREAEVKYSKEYASLYGLDPNGDLSSIMPKLYYNDYNEWLQSRVDVITDFVTNRDWNKDQQMIKSDVIKEGGNGTLAGDGLIDGIGMQGHLSDNNSVSQYINALKQYDSIVDEVQVTELDVKCTHRGENQWYYQAKFYYDLFAALIEAKKEGANITSVTVWGLTDDSSWIQDGYPLLFTYDLTAKPAYYAIAMAGKGEEFNMSMAEAILDLKDLDIDFEPYTDEYGKTTNYTPETAGFFNRGSGHISKLRLVTKINHTADVKLGYSLFCERSEQDASCMLDISKFSGKNVTITAYVKTDDSQVAIGLDTGESTELARISSSAEWKLISVNTDIPEKLSSVYVYFETDGNSPMYIDDVSVIYTKEGEEPAPVVTDGESVPVSAATTPAPSKTETTDNNDNPDIAIPESTEITSTPAPDPETTDTSAETDPAAATENDDNTPGSNLLSIILMSIGVILLAVGGYFIINAGNKNNNASKK